MNAGTGTLGHRRAGVLLHPRSLPAGDFGPDAIRFLDFLVQAGMGVWQMLPLAPTHSDLSPYHCLSAHALSPEFLSVEWLAGWGWGVSREMSRAEALRAAHAWFAREAPPAEHSAWGEFCAGQHHWLDDYALYAALRQEHGGQAWWDWEPALRDRVLSALEGATCRLAERLAEIRFEQFVLARQWQDLRDAARVRGILLFGDMPIFVAHDSADVWAQRNGFQLDARGHPEVVAGVPPDYFSDTGQRWGNPLYRWESMQVDGFAWWLARLQTELARFDLVRVDHFRGFEACWEIPADAPTAASGRWVTVPGAALFDAMLERFGSLPLVAEDLGVITPEVDALRERYRLPGMLVLQFAFDGGAANPYLPHNHRRDAVVYTGTHDNDTTCAWFEALPASQQQRVVDYLGHAHEPMPWPLIRAALGSVAQLAIVPMQDVLGLGAGHRMNLPGTTSGNWQWRFVWDDVPPGTAERLHRLVTLYGRL
jgi:4-alpha-glucanotransferase